MRAKTLGTALFAVLIAAAILSSRALAAPTTTKSHWRINGTTISSPASVKCSARTTFSLTSTVAGSPIWLTATGLTCLSNTTIQTNSVGGVDMAENSGTFEFTGVTVMEPAGCKLPKSTIITEFLKAKLEMDGVAVYDHFEANTGSTMASVELKECAAEGSYKLTGFVRGLFANPTTVESSDQVLRYNATSNAVSGLKLGGNTATLEGEANNELVGGGNFSATE